MEEKDYLEQALDKCYHLVTDTNYIWPSKFTLDMKIQLLLGFIAYWQEHEAYEKCAGLQRTIKQIKQDAESHS